MGDKLYRQQGLSLSQEEAEQMDALRAKGYKAIQIWRLGIERAKEIQKGIDDEALANNNS